MRLLDVYCGGGGAAYGYRLAGFEEIVGIDHVPQPRYPYEFILGDALEALDRLLVGGYIETAGGKRYYLRDFDAIHASPPCQFASIMRNLPWLRAKEYPALIAPTRDRLEKTGLPYVIENVWGARHGAGGLVKRGLEAHGLKAGWLCGGMFGLPFYRHRLFASNWFWLAPAHPRHTFTVRNGRTMGARARDIVHNGAQKLASNYGHAAGVGLAREAMGIPWMTRDELTQAIPPAYTTFIGRALLAHIRGGCIW